MKIVLRALTIAFTAVVVYFNLLTFGVLFDGTEHEVFIIIQLLVVDFILVPLGIKMIIRSYKIEKEIDEIEAMRKELKSDGR